MRALDLPETLDQHRFSHIPTVKAMLHPKAQLLTQTTSDYTMQTFIGFSGDLMLYLEEALSGREHHFFLLPTAVLIL